MVFLVPTILQNGTEHVIVFNKVFHSIPSYFAEWFPEMLKELLFKTMLKGFSQKTLPELPKHFSRAVANYGEQEKKSRSYINEQSFV